ncbi:54994a1b-19f9-4528-8241-3b50e794223e [Thermothielavioides terrestris]|jgi:outer membrane translocation and assembly module TamA
MLGF